MAIIFTLTRKSSGIDKLWQDVVVFVLKGSRQHSLNVLYSIKFYPYESTTFLKAFMCNFTFSDRIPEEAYLEFSRINFHEVFCLNQIYFSKDIHAMSFDRRHFDVTFEWNYSCICFNSWNKPTLESTIFYYWKWTSLLIWQGWRI